MTANDNDFGASDKRSASNQKGLAKQEESDDENGFESSKVKAMRDLLRRD